VVAQPADQWYSFLHQRDIDCIGLLHSWVPALLRSLPLSHAACEKVALPLTTTLGCAMQAHVTSVERRAGLVMMPKEYFSAAAALTLSLHLPRTACLHELSPSGYSFFAVLDLMQSLSTKFRAANRWCQSVKFGRLRESHFCIMTMIVCWSILVLGLALWRLQLRYMTMYRNEPAIDLVAQTVSKVAM
jgi:hypothetical protein